MTSLFRRLERREHVLQALRSRGPIRRRSRSLPGAFAHLLGGDVNKLLADMPDHPAIWSYVGTGQVSREFINFVLDFQSGQQFDSLTAALLCREAYELGRKEGRTCSPKESITTILVVVVTLVLLGAYLITHG